MEHDPSKQKANKDRFLQLEQKILHYRSEAANYEKKMEELKQQFKKERARNQYLQKKLVDIQKYNIENYEKKIAQLEEKLLQMEVELEEEKKQKEELMKLKRKEEPKTEEKKIEPVYSLQSHFSYSIILPSKDEDAISIIGDFIIQNTGNQPLHDIILCLRISPKEVGNLSGKIVMNRKNKREFNMDSPILQWEFLHENWMEKVRETGEYWLKPIGVKELPINETIAFSGFEVKLKKPDNQNSVIIDGFVYGKEIPNGTHALNNVVINF
jgi:hypothetical protein